MQVGVVAHPKKERAKTVAEKVIREIGEIDGLDVVVSELTFDLLGNKDIEVQPLEEMKANAIMCIGGDGTILRVLRLSNCPVLGINAGSLGFLTEVQPKDTKDALIRIIEGKYTVEKRTKISVVLNGTKIADVSNEVVLTAITPSKIQNYELNIDMVTSERIRSDGIIVSTPTGSTGYAMSAGGSIIEPKLKAFQIVPIAPFMMNMRPYIIPDSYMISMKLVGKTREANLVLDGSIVKKIDKEDDILLTKSKFTADFIKFDTPFYQRYKEKIAEMDNRQEL